MTSRTLVCQRTDQIMNVTVNLTLVCFVAGSGSVGIETWTRKAFCLNVWSSDHVQRSDHLPNTSVAEPQSGLKQCFLWSAVEWLHFLPFSKKTTTKKTPKKRCTNQSRETSQEGGLFNLCFCTASSCTLSSSKNDLVCRARLRDD